MNQPLRASTPNPTNWHTPSRGDLACFWIMFGAFTLFAVASLVYMFPYCCLGHGW